MGVLEELERSFAEITPPLSQGDALAEAERCLYCYDAPCTRACPTHIDVPAFIRKIRTGNLSGSARVILEANPVAASCARVCPVEELCEGACVLNRENRPITIGRLQRYVMDAAMAAPGGAPLLSRAPGSSRRVAVVGAGPAGLSAARELARAGVQVVLYEARPLAGGLDAYGIVSFRLPKAPVLWEVREVQRYGVELRSGVRVGDDVAPEELLREFDAVLLAGGQGRVPRLGIPGEDLPGVWDALEWIERTKSAPLHEVPVGRRVVVIGGGNTAVDAATAAHRLGAEEVCILYRRSEAEMPAYGSEFTFAKQEGVRFRFLTLPVRILGDRAVEGVECVRARLGEPDASGRPVPEPLPGSHFIVEADMVLRAIGQTRHEALGNAFGLSHREGKVVFDHATLRTENPKVFVAGDFAAGGEKATVVAAAEQGKQAARSILAALGPDAGSG